MNTIAITHVEQKWDAFCGPAVLAMLLSQHGVILEQHAIPKAAHVSAKQIDDLGMRLDQLALAVRKLAPNYTLWAKRHATFEDLHLFVNTYRLACGVEWQEKTSEEELEDLKKEGVDPEKIDMGHYSVVTGIDMEAKKLTLQNPSYYAHKKEQVFSIDEFESRWFDTNQLEKDAPEEAQEWIDDNHVLFLVAPKAMSFPESIGIKKIRIAPTFKKNGFIDVLTAKVQPVLQNMKKFLDKLMHRNAEQKIAQTPLSA
jgi:ABC-type bacteriocin/lantibiotic exporter with double-glycine peptidase domain